MPGGRGNIRPSDNPKPFTSENQPKKSGRKPSLKNQLAKIALSDGWLTFKAKDIEILEDGSVRVKVPKEEAMALKLFQIAMGKNPNASMNAIKTYLETFDGKAAQTIKGEIKLGKDKEEVWEDD